MWQIIKAILSRIPEIIEEENSKKLSSTRVAYLLAVAVIYGVWAAVCLHEWAVTNLWEMVTLTGAIATGRLGKEALTATRDDRTAKEKTKQDSVQDAPADR